MKELDFSFEQSPWETFLNGTNSGARIPAVHLLTMLEGEGEDTLEEVAELLEARKLHLELSGFPKGIGQGQAAVRLRREAELAQRQLKPKDFEENDPLRLYLEELEITPAFGDERILAERAAQGDERAMEQLTHLGLSWVVELAREFAGRGVLLLDLIQEGSLALWQTVQQLTQEDYEGQRDRRIRNAMTLALIRQARDSGLGQKLRTAMQDYRSVDDRLLSELGRNPTLEEIAEQLHMSREEAETVKKMLDNAYLLQQATKGTQPQEEAPEEETQAVEDTAYFQMRQRIMELLSQLTPEDAELLTLRYGLEKGRPMSAEEVGRRMNLTPEEVTAREAAALSRLRNA